MNSIFKVNEHNEITFSITGNLDSNGTAQVRNKIEKLAEFSNSHSIILDFKEVKCIDSSGIGAILFLYKRLFSYKKSLKIINAQGQPNDFMKKLRMNMIITIEE